MKIETGESPNDRNDRGMLFAYTPSSVDFKEWDESKKVEANHIF